MKGNNKSNEKKVILNFFSYDYSKVEEYLGTMAREGWILDHQKNSSWYFKKADPKAVIFRILPYKKSKNKNKDNTLNRSDLSSEIIVEAGWKRLDSSDGIHIFYNDNNIPFPGEDKSLTYSLIKENTLFSLIPNIFMCISLLLYTVIVFINAPIIDVLMNRPILLLYLILFPIITIVYIVELVKFIHWSKTDNKLPVEEIKIKNNILNAFKYRRFAIMALPLIFPLLALLFLAADGIYQEDKVLNTTLNLPLTLEDMNFPEANQIKNSYREGSILLNRTVYFDGDPTGIDVPNFQVDEPSIKYTIYKSELSFLDGYIKNVFLNSNPFLKESLTSIDSDSFGAEKAYFNEADGINAYFLEYDNKVVVIETNFSMTPEQMKTVREKLY